MPQDKVLAFLVGAAFVFVGGLLGIVSAIKVAFGSFSFDVVKESGEDAEPREPRGKGSAKKPRAESRWRSLVPLLVAQILLIAFGILLMYRFVRELYVSAVDTSGRDIDHVAAVWSEPADKPIKDLLIGPAGNFRNAPRAYVVVISSQGDALRTYSAIWHLQLTPSGTQIVAQKEVSKIASAGDYPPPADAPIFEVKGDSVYLVRYPQGDTHIRILSGGTRF
jgi:hypothetical protein